MYCWLYLALYKFAPPPEANSRKNESIKRNFSMYLKVICPHLFVSHSVCFSSEDGILP